MIATSTLLRARRARTVAGDSPCAERRGVAATELAVCMPLLVLVVLATMEACAMMSLQQSLTVAAYEGARAAVAPGGKTSDATNQCLKILEDREVRNADATASPSDIPGAAPGTWITVEAMAPFDTNSLAGGWLFQGTDLRATVQMMKER